MFRRVTRAEASRVHAFVEAIVHEVYGLPIPHEDWTGAWVVDADGAYAGIVKTFDHRVEDLWVARERRGAGVGARLLAHGEREIADRGHRIAHLRVISSNARARAFYEREGWRAAFSQVHDVLAVEMTEMTKAIGQA